MLKCVGSSQEHGCQLKHGGGGGGKIGIPVRWEYQSPFCDSQGNEWTSVFMCARGIVGLGADANLRQYFLPHIIQLLNLASNNSQCNNCWILNTW